MTRSDGFAGASSLTEVKAEVEVEFAVCSRQFAVALRLTEVKAEVEVKLAVCSLQFAGALCLLKVWFGLSLRGAKNWLRGSGFSRKLQIANWLRHFPQPLIFFLFLSRKKERSSSS
jgi:hypothetical protein